jgi:AraC-like DNA-binding protein
MFANQIEAAIAAAPLRALDDISQKAIIAWGKGAIDDSGMERIGEAIGARRAAAKAYQDASNGVRGGGSTYAPRQPHKAPQTPERTARRRRLAAAGPMPPALAASFTMGELAVMRIIANEFRQHGLCSLFLDAIADRAGCCRRTVQRALRVAADLGFITVTERRRRGKLSDTNLIEVVSPEWKTWLANGSQSKVTFSSPHKYKNPFSKKESEETAALRGDNGGRTIRKWSFEEGSKAKLSLIRPELADVG